MTRSEGVARGQQRTSSKRSDHVSQDDTSGASSGQRKYNPRRNTGAAEWGERNAASILQCIARLARNGGAVRFGYTRDGGAYAIGIYGDGQPYTVFVRPGEDVEGTLVDICDAIDAPDPT